MSAVEPPDAIKPRRALPLAGGLAAGLLILSGLGLILVNDRQYRAQRVSEANTQAAILAASTVAALDFGDPDAAAESVRALGANPQVRFAAVYDRSGALFAGSARPGVSVPRRAGEANADPAATVLGAAPVVRDGERIGSVTIGNARESLTRRLTRYGLVGLFVLLAATVAAILGFARAALGRANRELSARAGALAESNRRLGEEMEERARAEEELRQAHKMQALGQLTGGIAHDFNNLLTVIQGSADMLKRPDLPDDRRLRYTAAISDTAGRAAALTSQLLSFARRQPLRPRSVHLSRHVEGMAELLDRALGERVRVVLDLGEDSCPVTVDPVQLENAILNIAVNARDAMPDGGTLTIRVAPAADPLEGGRALDLSVADTGEGIAADTLAHVFEPFFTTKGVGKGTGLGLSQVYGFAAQSGGRAGIVSRPGEGATVTLTLPCATDHFDAPEDASPALAPERPRTGRVLVVDDNEAVGAFAEAMLTELGFRVLRARSGEEALEIAAAAELDIVFSDVVMPGISGVDLAERLAVERPGLPLVLTTGFSDELASARARRFPVLFKPYSVPKLVAALDGALAEPARSA